MNKLLPLAGFLLFSFTHSNGQENISSNPNYDWFNKDLKKDEKLGVSTDEAYTYMKDKKSSSIIVAVIDSGVDIEHEDLRSKRWINENEIAGNNIDDDNNGYIDDVFGWNFLGNDKGEMIEGSTLELTRLYMSIKDGSYKPSSTGFPDNKTKTEDWKEIISNEFKKEYDFATENSKAYAEFLQVYDLIDQYLKNLTGKETYSIEDLKKIDANTDEIKQAVEFMTSFMEEGEGRKEIEDALEYFNSQALYHYNDKFRPKFNLGLPLDTINKFYGNNNIIGEGADHGTHVAGIIGAQRNNDIGINGIAENVLIMPIRAVPNGDEFDVDIANAIRYAVDNGARIINCSFGKKYSPQLSYVKSAFKYAEDKGVLIIHAAGNDSENIDKVIHYPTDKKRDAKTAFVNNVITVGASSQFNSEELTGDFSNYGKKNVDIFAPGVDILSTTPNNDYQKFSGTSMACPSVAGVAALVLSYYPELSAVQLKEIIINSALDYKKFKVYLPGSGKTTKLGKISRNGGVLNALNAVKYAEEYTSKM